MHNFNFVVFCNFGAAFCYSELLVNGFVYAQYIVLYSLFCTTCFTHIAHYVLFFKFIVFSYIPSIFLFQLHLLSVTFSNSFWVILFIFSLHKIFCQKENPNKKIQYWNSALYYWCSTVPKTSQANSLLALATQ